MLYAAIQNTSGTRSDLPLDLDLDVGDRVVVRSQNRIGTIVKVLPVVFGEQWYKVHVGVEPDVVLFAEEQDLWAWRHWV